MKSFSILLVAELYGSRVSSWEAGCQPRVSCSRNDFYFACSGRIHNTSPARTLGAQPNHFVQSNRTCGPRVSVSTRSSHKCDTQLQRESPFCYPASSPLIEAGRELSKPLVKPLAETLIHASISPHVQSGHLGARAHEILSRWLRISGTRIVTPICSLS